MHCDCWLAFLYFCYKQGWEPFSNLDFIDVNGSNFCCDRKIFPFNAVVDAGWHFLASKFFEDANRFWFFDKIPFIENAVFARNCECIGVGSDC